MRERERRTTSFCLLYLKSNKYAMVEKKKIKTTKKPRGGQLLSQRFQSDNQIIVYRLSSIS